MRSWERMRVTRRLHLMLAPHGLAYLVARIHDTFGDSAHRLVAEHPYELTSVFGVGFLIADRIARSLGTGELRDRARAGALHLLVEAERSGSTCMPLDGLLGCAPRARWRRDAPDEAFVDELVARGDLVREEAVDLPPGHGRARGRARRAGLAS